MRVGSHLCAAVLSIPLAFLQAYAAQALECPAGGAVVGNPEQAAAISATLGGGAAFEDLEWLNNSINDLIGRGIPRTAIIDDMIGAYCQQVAAGGGLSDAAQAAKIRTFASRITQVAYAGGESDEIILNVPFSAAIIKKIDDRARAAGVSADAWVANAIEENLD